MFDLKILFPHFIQTPEWAVVRRKMGEEVLEFQSQYLRIKAAPKPLKPLGYMEQVDVNSLDLMLLINTARSRGLSHVMLDPQNIEGEVLLTRLQQATGHKVSVVKGTATFHRTTVVVDLNDSEELMLTKMHPKTRYNTRLGAKKGLTFELSDSEEVFNQFLKLHADTAHRQGYFARSDNYLRKVWQELQPQGKAKIALATFEGKPLTAWMLYLGERGVYYPYGGSSDEHRNLMSAYFLVWEVIKWAKAEGYQFFDLWGAEESMPGVRRFKLGFGGEEIQYAEAIDVVIDPVYYRLFKLANAMRWMILKVKKALGL